METQHIANITQKSWRKHNINQHNGKNEHPSLMDDSKKRAAVWVPVFKKKHGQPYRAIKHVVVWFCCSVKCHNTRNCHTPCHRPCHTPCHAPCHARLAAEFQNRCFWANPLRFGLWVAASSMSFMQGPKEWGLFWCSYHLSVLWMYYGMKIKVNILCNYGYIFIYMYIYVYDMYIYIYIYIYIHISTYIYTPCIEVYHNAWK